MKALTAGESRREAKKASVPVNDNVSSSFSIYEPSRLAVTEVDHVRDSI